MCEEPKFTTTKNRLLTKEDALAHLERLKNGELARLDDHIFVDYFKGKRTKEETSK